MITGIELGRMTHKWQFSRDPGAGAGRIVSTQAGITPTPSAAVSNRWASG